VNQILRLMLCSAALALSVSVASAQTTDTNSSSSMSSTSMSSTTMNGSMMGGSMMMGHTDWSHRYQLTPLEMKRLRAYGLSDEEVFAIANASEEGNVPLDAPTFDSPLDMRLRGRANWQIAEKLNIPASDMQRMKPEWQTAEWNQAVEQGSWYAHPAAMNGTMGTTTTTTTRSRSTTTETTTPSTTDNNQNQNGNQ